MYKTAFSRVPTVEFLRDRRVTKQSVAVRVTTNVSSKSADGEVPWLALSANLRVRHNSSLLESTSAFFILSQQEYQNSPFNFNSAKHLELRSIYSYIDRFNLQWFWDFTSKEKKKKLFKTWYVRNLKMILNLVLKFRKIW